MATTVDDFRDWLSFLDRHPEWRDELRRRLLTDDLLEVPGILRRMVEAQARTEERLAELAAAQARTEERLDRLEARVDQRFAELAAAQARTEERLAELAAAQVRTEERLDRLAEAQARTEEQLAALGLRVDRLTDRVGEHGGKILELDYARKGAGYFSRIANRLRELRGAELDVLLDDAVEAGTLTDDERQEIILSDIVFEGRRRDDRSPVYLLVEVSWGIGESDIMRAANRSRLLARLGRPVIPVVAGSRLDPPFDQVARAHGVWAVLDGRTISPEQSDGGSTSTQSA